MTTDCHLIYVLFYVKLLQKKIWQSKYVKSKFSFLGSHLQFEPVPAAGHHPQNGRNAGMPCRLPNFQTKYTDIGLEIGHLPSDIPAVSGVISSCRHKFKLQMGAWKGKFWLSIFFSITIWRRKSCKSNENQWSLFSLMSGSSHISKCSNWCRISKL